MFKHQVKVGHTYRARICGRKVDVRIIEKIEFNPSFRYSPLSGRRNLRSYTHWDALNLWTGRTIVIKSAQKLEYEVTASMISDREARKAERMAESRSRAEHLIAQAGIGLVNSDESAFDIAADYSI